MDVSQFRQAFPEFDDKTQYPDALVQFWMSVAVPLVNAERWGELTDLGGALITAHHLALAVKDQKVAAIGGAPGQVTGPQSSKGVDKVSVSYDTGAVAMNDGGFWNATMYGIRYLNLVRIMGAGGVQL